MTKSPVVLIMLVLVTGAVIQTREALEECEYDCETICKNQTGITEAECMVDCDLIYCTIGDSGSGSGGLGIMDGGGN